jgi:rhamnogalacturonan endolyase
MRSRTFSTLLGLVLCLLATPAHGQRIMEKLGRGFVAVKSGTGTYLSWRLWGTEQGTDIAFNVYKGTTKLNSAPITTSTNYQDTSTGTGDYSVKAVIGGVEEATGEKAMLNLQNDYLEIPLRAAPGKAIHLAYVADLDGDGEYEYIVDRVQTNASQFVDAYKRDGTFMWRVDMGPNSTNTDLSLSGPDTISVGHADNEAAFDVDGDGKGEVILRGGNGMIFGDGKVLAASTTATDSFIVAIDGVTGAEKGKEVLVPQDLIATGNVTGHFSSAYFDGVHPSLYYKGKAGGTRAMMDMGFDFKNGAWSLRFKAVRSPISAYPNFHQVRCLDLNQDGKDECINGGYALDGAGTVLWNQATIGGTVHGDRWHVGDMDPGRPGLEGFSISQNATSYDWFTWDAKDGSIIRKYGAGGTDMGRGTCGDVDPAHKGYECWTGGKVFCVSETTGSQIGTTSPPQNFRIFWDGDVLSENLDDVTISKWAYPGMPSGGFTSKTLVGVSSWRQAVPLYGDMFGDWREEVLLENSAATAIRIYTTTIPTEKRIYTLMHDPEYRNSMNEKGYQQSHMLDYYLGDGMTDPPKPNITYPNATPGGTGGAGAGGTTGAGGSASGGTTGAGGSASGGTTGAGDAGRGGTTGSGDAGRGGTTGAGGATSDGGATGAGGGGDGGATGSGGTSSGGVGATGGAVVGGSGGNSGTGGTTVVASGGTGTVATGGAPASGGAPATGGSPATGGTTVVATGGTQTVATGGTTAVAPATGGSVSSGSGGAVGGQSGTKVVAAGSGCSCAIGAASGRGSAGYLVAILGMLGLVLNRRRRRGGFRG